LPPTHHSETQGKAALRAAAKRRGRQLPRDYVLQGSARTPSSWAAAKRQHSSGVQPSALTADGRDAGFVISHIADGLFRGSRERRQWQLAGAATENVEQLAKPHRPRRKALEANQAIFVKGHIGKQKKDDHNMQRIFWPRRVATSCNPCFRDLSWRRHTGVSTLCRHPMPIKTSRGHLRQPLAT